MTLTSDLDSGSSTDGLVASGERARTKPRDGYGTLALIAGDWFHLSSGLPELLKDCGIRTPEAPRTVTLQHPGNANPDLVVVVFAEVRDATPARIRTLRERYGKPVVCMLPCPEEDELSQVAALGADLLLFTPLSAAEVKCRIGLLLMAQRSHDTRPFGFSGHRRPPIEFVGGGREVVCDGRRLRLTGKEHALLSLLAADPGRVFSTDDILEAVWAGCRRASSADVHQCVYRLRLKVETDPRDPRFVISVPSMGYKLGRF